MSEDCMHEWLCITHLGEVMDMIDCLECGIECPRFLGRHKTGSILEMPDHERPRSSRSTGFYGGGA